MACTKTNLQLMDEAERIVTATYPDAMLVAADGVPSSGLATGADGVDEWLFLFQLLGKGESVTVRCLDGCFDPPRHHPHPVTDVCHETLPRSLSLDAAIRLARKAGYGNAIKSVSLFKSLLPGTTEAAYTFIPLYLLVGATSGRIRQEP